MVFQQLVQWSVHKDNPIQVTQGLKNMLRDIAENISQQHIDKDGEHSTRDISMMWNADDRPDCRKESKQSRESDGRTHSQTGLRSTFTWQSRINAKTFTRSESFWEVRDDAQQNFDIIEKLLPLQERYKATKDKSELSLMGRLPNNHMLGCVDGIINILKETGVDIGMAKLVNQTFLTLVSKGYWELMQEGDLRPGSDEAQVLLTSVRMAQSPLSPDLKDYAILRGDMQRTLVVDGAEWWRAFESDHELARRAPSTQAAGAHMQSRTRKCVRSGGFNVAMALAIFLNGIWVVIEELTRNDSNKHMAIWLAVEIGFCSIFVLEAALKLQVQGPKYFKDGSNIFDFFLAILGVAGVVLGVMETAVGDIAPSEARIIRLARIFRVLRFLRVFRLFHAKLSQDKEVLSEVACHMKTITCLRCFISAHLQAQMKLVKYFGGNNEIDDVSEAELGRCVLQSQVAVYHAIEDLVKERLQLSSEPVQELENAYRRKAIAQNLESFIMHAHTDGAISAREAATILHPLHHQIYKCMRTIDDLDEGIARKQTPDRSSHRHESDLRRFSVSAVKRFREAFLGMSSPSREQSGFSAGSGGAVVVKQVSLGGRSMSSTNSEASDAICEDVIVSDVNEFEPVIPGQPAR